MSTHEQVAGLTFGMTAAATRCEQLLVLPSEDVRTLHQLFRGPLGTEEPLGFGTCAGILTLREDCAPDYVLALAFYLLSMADIAVSMRETSTTDRFAWVRERLTYWRPDVTL